MVGAGKNSVPGKAGPLQPLLRSCGRLCYDRAALVGAQCTPCTLLVGGEVVLYPPGLEGKHSPMGAKGVEVVAASSPQGWVLIRPEGPPCRQGPGLLKVCCNDFSPPACPSVSTAKGSFCPQGLRFKHSHPRAGHVYTSKHLFGAPAVSRTILTIEASLPSFQPHVACEAGLGCTAQAVVHTAGPYPPAH